MVDLGHENVVACDATFGTNDKILSTIFLQYLIFSGSTWAFCLSQFPLYTHMVFDEWQNGVLTT
jgi:hypothetical protein